jgi:hypothetical protein
MMRPRGEANTDQNAAWGHRGCEREWKRSAGRESDGQPSAGRPWDVTMVFRKKEGRGAPARRGEGQPRMPLRENDFITSESSDRIDIWILGRS